MFRLVQPFDLFPVGIEMVRENIVDKGGQRQAASADDLRDPLDRVVELRADVDHLACTGLDGRGADEQGLVIRRCSAPAVYPVVSFSCRISPAGFSLFSEHGY